MELESLILIVCVCVFYSFGLLTERAPNVNIVNSAAPNGQNIQRGLYPSLIAVTMRRLDECVRQRYTQLSAWAEIWTVCSVAARRTQTASIPV